MEFSLIVAIGENREIGKNNDLLWRLPNDMKFFKETTIGHTVIMGRKNWESIPEKFRPLTDRKNIVLTTNSNYQAAGAIVITDFNKLNEEAGLLSNQSKNFIIGGAQIYQLALLHLDITEMYITHVHATFEADTFFPKISLEDWKSETIYQQEKDAKHTYSFEIKRYWK